MPRGGFRPGSGRKAETFRLLPEHLASIDAWRARQPDPVPSRQEAVNRILMFGLASQAAHQSTPSR